MPNCPYQARSRTRPQKHENRPIVSRCIVLLLLPRPGGGSYTNQSQMNTPTFPSGSTLPLVDFLSCTPSLSHSDNSGCPARFIQFVANVLIEHEHPVPERARLTMIAEAALAARHIFFTAVACEPTQFLLDSSGWRLLTFSRLPSMPLDAIDMATVDCTKFMRPVIDRRTNKPTDEMRPCSATYINQALRTLKAMMGKAVEWKVLKAAPKIHTLKSSSRDRLIDAESESKLHDAYLAPQKNARNRKMREQAWLIMVIYQDTGMRPDEVFPMRIEEIHWNENYIWIPEGKTENSRRRVGMSERVKQMLSAWCTGRNSGWVFPS